MAERRMFAKTIIDSDAFLEMPISTRLLYYDLSMRADDDGFVNSPKKIMKIVGASQNDLDLLILKKFILPFENGVVVIKHWKIHNYIRKDTYNETQYKEQKAMLELDENKSYRFINSSDFRAVDEPSTQFSLGKVNKLNYTKLNIYYLFIIGKVENFEEISQTERQVNINILKKLDIFIDDPKTDDVITDDERRKLVYQYWAIKEINDSGDKVFIKNLTREIFLNKFLKTCEYVDLNNETDFLNYFIKALKNKIEEIEEKRIRK